MPYYGGLRVQRSDNEVRRAEKKRITAGLQRLREQIRTEVGKSDPTHDFKIPPRTLSSSLLLATWNLREFGGTKYGGRIADPYHYIAEVISHFDLVAIQEVRENLDTLEKVQRILGRWWKVLYTDVTEGFAGNGERSAFVYDSRKVEPSGLVGEIVLPEDPKDAKKGEKPIRQFQQFARSPFICGFRAGWSLFNLCTVHIYYGESKAIDPRRLEEIRLLAEFMRKRAERQASSDADNVVLLGDFNIFKTTDETYKVLEKNNFVMPKGLIGSNANQDKHFDQIAVYQRQKRFAATGKAGVLNYFKSVFRDTKEDYETFAALAPKIKSAKNPANAYKMWRTYQMSDHMPLWMELRIDFTDDYLEEIAKARADTRVPPIGTDAGAAKDARAVTAASPRPPAKKKVAKKKAAKKKGSKKRAAKK